MRFLSLLMGVIIIFVSLSLENGYAQQEGLKLWLSFQGSGDTEKDVSGNGNDGKIVGGAKRVAGKYGSGVSIGKKDQYVEIPSVLQPKGTIEFWFKPNWNGNEEETYRLFDATVNPTAWSIGKGKGSGAARDRWGDMPERFGFFMEDLMAGGADMDLYAWFLAEDVITAGDWYHAAATWEYNGGVAKFYLNGEEAVDTDYQAPELRDMPKLAKPRIGLSTDAGYFFAHHGADAVIDEFAIYDRVLDIDEIREDMKALAAVEPFHKLPIAWGEIKSK